MLYDYQCITHTHYIPLPTHYVSIGQSLLLQEPINLPTVTTFSKKTLTTLPHYHINLTLKYLPYSPANKYSPSPSCTQHDYTLFLSKYIIIDNTLLISVHIHKQSM